MLNVCPLLTDTNDRTLSVVSWDLTKACSTTQLVIVIISWLGCSKEDHTLMFPSDLHYQIDNSQPRVLPQEAILDDGNIHQMLDSEGDKEPSEADEVP